MYTTITNDIREYYSNLHLIQTLLDYSYGRLGPISTKEYLYNPEIKNQWFLNKNKLLCINAPSKDDVINAINILEIEPGSQLFYHTTNWKHLETVHVFAQNEIDTILEYIMGSILLLKKT